MHLNKHKVSLKLTNSGDSFIYSGLSIFFPFIYVVLKPDISLCAGKEQLSVTPEVTNEEKYQSLARMACTGIAAQRIAAMERPTTKTSVSSHHFI